MNMKNAIKGKPRMNANQSNSSQKRCKPLKAKIPTREYQLLISICIKLLLEIII